MRISEKMERYWRGGTKLNRMQVKRTGNLKKIRWTAGNKSNSPHLRGKFLLLWGDLVLWSNKTKKLKLCQKKLGRAYILYTGRAPAAAHGPATGTEAEVFVFLELARLPPPG